MEEPWVQRIRDVLTKEKKSIFDSKISDDHHLMLRSRDGSYIDAGEIKEKQPGSIAYLAYYVYSGEPDIYSSKDGDIWSAAASAGRFTYGTSSHLDSGCWTGDRFLVSIGQVFHDVTLPLTPSSVRFVTQGTVEESVVGDNTIETLTFDLSGIEDGDTVLFYIFPGAYIVFDSGASGGASVTSTPSWLTPNPSVGDPFWTLGTFFDRTYVYMGDWDVSDGSTAIFTTESQLGMRGAAGWAVVLKNGSGTPSSISSIAIQTINSDPFVIDGWDGDTADVIVFGFATNRDKSISIANAETLGYSSLVYTDAHTWELPSGSGSGGPDDPSIERRVDLLVSYAKGVRTWTPVVTEPSNEYTPADWDVHGSHGLIALVIPRTGGTIEVANSALLQSKDGGSWSYQPDNEVFSYTDSFICAFAATGTGFVVAVGQHFGYTSDSKIAVSYDFGETWKVIPNDVADFLSDSSIPTIYGVVIKNEFEWCVTDGNYNIWYTYDGGAHWTDVVWPSSDFYIDAFDSNGMHFFNDYWWINGTGSGSGEWDTPLIRSKDLVNWEPVVTPWSGMYPPTEWFIAGIDPPEEGSTPMAEIDVTLLVAGEFASGETSWVTDSYFLEDNALLLAFITTDGYSTAMPASVDGNGLTWHLVESVGYNATATVMWVYRAMGTGLTAGPLTVIPGDTLQEGQIHVIQATGVDTSGVDGAGAIAHHGYDRADESTGAQPAGDSITVTIPGASTSEKVIVAGFNNTLNPTDYITPETDWSELGTTFINGALHRTMFTEWKKTVDVSASASSPGNITQWMGIALELVPGSLSLPHFNDSGSIYYLKHDRITNVVVAHGYSNYTYSVVMMSRDGGEHWFEIGFLRDDPLRVDHGWDGYFYWNNDWLVGVYGSVIYAFGWWFIAVDDGEPADNVPPMVRISSDGKITETVYMPHQKQMEGYMLLSGGDIT